MNPATFEWDDENIEHIALHGVDIVEAEAVLDNRPLVLRTQDRSLPSRCFCPQACTHSRYQCS